MYIVGFLKTDFPEVLINPVPFQQVEELYGWLREFSMNRIGSYPRLLLGRAWIRLC